MAEHVTLTLSRDEAIVFYEWLTRFNSSEEHRFEDQSEQRVMWDLEASLESTLAEPLRPDYIQVLADSRSRVRDASDR
jgi:hypothetical protein